eukprot:6084394-Pyramimonas_sp.AAC.1
MASPVFSSSGAFPGLREERRGAGVARSRSSPRPHRTPKGGLGELLRSSLAQCFVSCVSIPSAAGGCALLASPASPAGC